MNYSEGLSRSTVSVPPSDLVKRRMGLTRPLQSMESRTPIPFSKRMATFVQREVMSILCHPNPEYYSVRSIGNPMAEAECRRFGLYLRAYSDTYEGNPPIPMKQLLEWILLEDACDLLKRAKLKSFLKRVGHDLLDRDPVVEASPYVPWLRDIGDVFNYRYWFFWDKPDPGDDEWYWHPYNGSDTGLMNRLEELILENLPSGIEEVDPEDILLGVSSAGCQTQTGGRSKAWKVKGTAEGLKFSDRPLVGLNTYVQKCPGDTRSAITLTVPQSNTVRWFEAQVARVADKMLFSAYTRNPESFNKRYNDFKKHHTTFLMRDLKKDGITKPRPLIQLVVRALQQRYPDWKIWKYAGIWSDFFLIKDGKKLNPPRGVGLGMTGALTTILQAGILLLTIEEMAADTHILGTIDGLFYHDDAAIGFTDDGDVDEFNDVEDRVFSQLGLLRNNKKSYVGDEFVLCERYSNEQVNRKLSYFTCTLMQPFVGVNITHAKVLFSSVFDWEIPTAVEPYLSRIVAYWGHEFYDGEEVEPFSFGGWVPSSYLGVDTSLIQVGHIDNKKYRAMLACKPLTLELNAKEKNHNKWISPFERKYGDLSKCPEPSIFNIGVTYSQLQRKMSRFLQPGTLSRAYSKAHGIRQTIFHETRVHEREFFCKMDVYKKYLSLHSGDILPFRGIFNTEYAYEWGEQGWLPTPSALGYLKYHCNITVDRKVLPDPRLPNVRTDEQFTIGRTVQTRWWANDVPVIQSSKFKALDDWFNSSAVLSAWQWYTGEFGVPITGSNRNKGFSEFYHQYRLLFDDELSKYRRLLWKRIGSYKVLDVDLFDLAAELNKIKSERKTIPQPKDPTKERIKHDTMIDMNVFANEPPLEEPEETYGTENYWDWDRTKPELEDESLQQAFLKVGELVEEATFVSNFDHGQIRVKQPEPGSREYNLVKEVLTQSGIAFVIKEDDSLLVKTVDFFESSDFDDDGEGAFGDLFG
jgi:hypothetical protein